MYKKFVKPVLDRLLALAFVLLFWKYTPVVIKKSKKQISDRR